MKKFISVLLVIVACLSIIGCGKKVDPLVGKWTESYVVYDGVKMSEDIVKSSGYDESELIVREDMTYTFSFDGNAISGVVDTFESDEGILYILKLENGTDTGIILNIDPNNPNEFWLTMGESDLYIIYSK